MPTPKVSLYRLTLPPVMGVSKKRQASDMPSMASTSWAMISGRSGLPKLRQLVAATGSAAIAIERHRDGGAGLLDAHDGGVSLFGNGERVGAHLEIVLLPNPPFGTDVGSCHQGGKGGLHVGFGRAHPRALHFGRRAVGAVVKGRLVGQFAVGNLGHDFAVMADA